MNEYEPKAQVSKITAYSKATIKIRDNYFSTEYQEERVIPQVDGVDIAKEREALWDTVNAEVDNQMAIIVDTFRDGNGK